MGIIIKSVKYTQSNQFTQFDHDCMQQALAQAELAAEQQEVPVGAVLVHEQQIIAKGHNQPIQLADPTAHAEIVVLRAAAQYLSNYRLLDTTLYVTLEPCLMCVGAIIHARVARVVFAADDPKAGAVSSKFKLLGSDQFNHIPQCQGGLCARQASQLLKQFFQQRRKKH